MTSSICGIKGLCPESIEKMMSGYMVGDPLLDMIWVGFMSTNHLFGGSPTKMHGHAFFGGAKGRNKATIYPECQLTILRGL